MANCYAHLGRSLAIRSPEQAQEYIQNNQILIDHLRQTMPDSVDVLRLQIQQCLFEAEQAVVADDETRLQSAASELETSLSTNLLYEVWSEWYRIQLTAIRSFDESDAIHSSRQAMDDLLARIVVFEQNETENSLLLHSAMDLRSRILLEHPASNSSDHEAGASLAQLLRRQFPDAERFQFGLAGACLRVGDVQQAESIIHSLERQGLSESIELRLLKKWLLHISGKPNEAVSEIAVEECPRELHLKYLFRQSASPGNGSTPNATDALGE
ncbi:MAG: hypothetical protein R3C03_16670 [Pirellulaceae bacterium]